MLSVKEIKEANELLQLGARFIARDRDGELWAYTRARKHEGFNMWVCHASGECFRMYDDTLFKSVSWRDKKATSIRQLIGKHNASVKRRKRRR